ncbi:hypothetical protein PINS_up014554 [Pythium insidiosum]|nr:hypothetical protein PINS_up014554 [Pythium insidiosum]
MTFASWAPELLRDLFAGTVDLVALLSCCSSLLGSSDSFGLAVFGFLGESLGDCWGCLRAEASEETGEVTFAGRSSDLRQLGNRLY